ncbi:cytochrome P450 [uncultured Williamsia sp.]|uniref:cytochrome P450 n=1 Tax=uncultured Williamsia sp. TaxID=259311 RepID=UPI002630F346|nr:cytochrome P450 [uncultured Williamsia sp.]
MSTQSVMAAARDIGSPLLGAAKMNLEMTARTKLRGSRAWAGATNTGYDPLDPATAAQPFEAYRGLHEHGARVFYNPRRATWIIPGHEDVRTALRSTDSVTSTQGVTRFKISAPVLVLSDGAEHVRLRKQVQPAFTKGAMNAWQETVDRMAEELVAAVLADPGCDVVTKLAIPLPIRVIANILGIPESDGPQFRRWSEEGVGFVNASASPAGMAQAYTGLTAILALRRYFKEQFASGRLTASDTVFGRLLEYNEGGDLDENGLFFIAMLLLFAGNETTTNLIGGMMDTLAHRPDDFEAIRADPDLIPAAVEEQLRFTSPIQNLYRYTRAPHQVGEVTIPTGSRLMMSFGAANRDPSVFDDPDTYRVDRNPRTHIAFGYGPHMCIGAILARMEAQAVLRELTRQASAITADGPTTWSTHSSLRGPTRLPIRLTPA